MQLPLPGAVKLTEINTLPGAKNRPTILQRNKFARSDKRTFQVRGTVTFKMVVAILKGNDLVQLHDHVTGDIGVGIFINGNGSGCMWDKEVDDTVTTF